MFENVLFWFLMHQAHVACCNKDIGLVLLKVTKSKANPLHLDIVILVIKFTTSHDVHAKSQSDFYSVPAVQVHVLIYSQLE